MSIHLHYLIPARYPTEKAYGHQITSMARAWRRVGVDLTLWRGYMHPPSRASGGRLRTTGSTVGSYAGGAITLGPLEVWHLLWLPSFIWFRVLMTQFVLTFLAKRFERDAVMFTRLPLLAPLARLKGHPVFLECHQWFPSWVGVRMAMARRATGIITTNTYIADEFMQRGIDAKRVLVVPNGVDREIFDIGLTQTAAIAELPISPDDRTFLSEHNVLLYTGSFRTMGEEKGIAECIEALALLDDPSLGFVAVGGSALDQAHYVALARERGVEAQVRLYGQHEQSVLARFQCSADILMMPFPDRAHYREHMSPLKTFEYLCSKRPIIASTLPSLQAILSKETAFWCEPDDPQGLATVIRAVLADPAEATRRAEAAYGMVDAYTWDARARAITTFIEEHIPAS